MPVGRNDCPRTPAVFVRVGSVRTGLRTTLTSARHSRTFRARRRLEPRPYGRRQRVTRARCHRCVAAEARGEMGARFYATPCSFRKSRVRAAHVSGSSIVDRFTGLPRRRWPSPFARAADPCGPAVLCRRAQHGQMPPAQRPRHAARWAWDQCRIASAGEDPVDWHRAGP